VKSNYNTASQDGYSFDEIAVELGISRQRAQQMYHCALRKLRRECLKHGLEPGVILSQRASMLGKAQDFAHEGHNDIGGEYA